MPVLYWENWWRTEGCREWMDETSFAGLNLSSIFWKAMRLLFYDEPPC